MSEVLERRSYKVGETVFREGEAGSTAYIIQAGAIDIVREVDGKPKVLASIGAGGVFGEMALVDDKPRMATAVCSEAATIITITKNMYEMKLRKTDPFIRGLLKILVETIRRSA